MRRVGRDVAATDCENGQSEPLRGRVEVEPVLGASDSLGLAERSGWWCVAPEAVCVVSVSRPPTLTETWGGGGRPWVAL